MTRRKSTALLALPKLPKWKRIRQGYWRVELLRLREDARQSPEWQVRKLRGSIRLFGYCQPLLIDKSGLVLCGAARLRALLAEGYATAPVIVAPPKWGAREIAAFVRFDNDFSIGCTLPDLEIDAEPLVSFLPSIEDNITSSEFPLKIDFSTRLDRDEAIERIKKAGLAR